jgi:serine/threonine protein kinase
VLPAEFGRYRVLRLLGRGGMGAVYLAHDTQLGRQVALKMPFLGAAESPQRAERFVREARSAAVLQHPNICTVFDAGQIDGRPFLTMAYIAGTPLEAEIDPEAPMSQVRAAEIARKIALALEHAHRKGIVHRDLKPANIMLTAEGDPVVMDFGLARRHSEAENNEAKLTHDGGIVGTPSYVSPEQVKGRAGLTSCPSCPFRPGP